MPVTRQTTVVSAKVAAGMTWKQSVQLPGVAGTNDGAARGFARAAARPGAQPRVAHPLPARVRRADHERRVPAAVPRPAREARRRRRPPPRSATSRRPSIKLKRFQASDGGFQFWPGWGDSDDWSTTYVGHFLLEAKARGFELPAEMLGDWTDVPAGEGGVLDDEVGHRRALAVLPAVHARPRGQPLARGDEPAARGVRPRRDGEVAARRGLQAGRAEGGGDPALARPRRHGVRLPRAAGNVRVRPPRQGGDPHGALGPRRHDEGGQARRGRLEPALGVRAVQHPDHRVGAARARPVRALDPGRHGAVVLLVVGTGRRRCPCSRPCRWRSKRCAADRRRRARCP